MIRTTVSTANLREHMGRLLRKTPEVRNAIIKQSVHKALQWMILKAPKDTRRFVRQVGQAGNGAQAGPLPVADVRSSSRHERYIELLTEQVEGWRAYADRLGARIEYLYPKGPPLRGGRSSLYATLLRKRDQAERTYQKAVEELRKAADAQGTELFVGFLSGQTQKGRKLLTVRDKVYGGDGKFVERTSGAWCELTFKEPHTVFVERRNHLIAQASGVMRAHGIVRSRGAIVRSALAAGFAAGSGGGAGGGASA